MWTLKGWKGRKHFRGKVGKGEKKTYKRKSILQNCYRRGKSRYVIRIYLYINNTTGPRAYTYVFLNAATRAMLFHDEHQRDRVGSWLLRCQICSVMHSIRINRNIHRALFKLTFIYHRRLLGQLKLTREKRAQVFLFFFTLYSIFQEEKEKRKK